MLRLTMFIPKSIIKIKDDAFFLIAILYPKLLISINNAFDALFTFHLPFKKVLFCQIVISQIREHFSHSIVGRKSKYTILLCFDRYHAIICTGNSSFQNLEELSRKSVLHNDLPRMFHRTPGRYSILLLQPTECLLLQHWVKIPDHVLESSL